VYAAGAKIEFPPNKAVTQDTTRKQAFILDGFLTLCGMEP